MSVNVCFDKYLAMEIYAASDIYLMPSRSEPCGLSQMIAMRYGSIPVVHNVGGLSDTVKPFDKESGEGFGFVFSDLSQKSMVDALALAVETFRNDAEAWDRLVRNSMCAELSWKESAGKYMELYKSLMKTE